MDISEHLQKIIAAKVVAAVSDAYNQALEKAGAANTTGGLKEKYAGDLPTLVQKFNELKAKFNQVNFKSSDIDNAGIYPASKSARYRA